MVSSTFDDLVKHRQKLLQALAGQRLLALAMESDSARTTDVLASSLEKVRQASAYIGVIAHRYGSIPDSSQRNPDGLSLSQLEFNEARRLGLPILLFIMGDRHPVNRAGVETDPAKIKKLEAYIRDAKRYCADIEDGDTVERVYAEFNSLSQFGEKAIQAIAELRRELEDVVPPEAPQPSASARATRTLEANQTYLGSHRFVGRREQLALLDEWAGPESQDPLLVVQAIGGTGKSMLAWEWLNHHAPSLRTDWAGRFWYSFYEKGAFMADFCRRALAYTTGRPPESFEAASTEELGRQLLAELQQRPWLFVLDGIERVLVFYQRWDAAQVRDQDVRSDAAPEERHPCASIRPEDDALLRSLTAASPSRLLLTTRLMPRALLNVSGCALPGVRAHVLQGLQPRDAEALLVACGVTGNSEDIQTYLKIHCGCHPLVIGVLAGLINNHLPDRGSFDAWAAAPSGGGRLNLAGLQLIQKQNHILEAAFAALPEKPRQLLLTLALLPRAVDYVTLLGLNPYWYREGMLHEGTGGLQRLVGPENVDVDEEDGPPATGPSEAERRLAEDELMASVRDLEVRGLLQYDAPAKRYDLHPVVRGVTAGGLTPTEKERFGQRAVDHFSARAHNPFASAEALEDVQDGLHVVHVSLEMGKFQQAYEAYRGDLSDALSFNLEATVEELAILRVFFQNQWTAAPRGVDRRGQGYLASSAGTCLRRAGDLRTALSAYGTAIVVALQQEDWPNVRIELSNFAGTLLALNELAKADWCCRLSLEVAELLRDPHALFVARLERFRHLAEVGGWQEAVDLWPAIAPSTRPGSLPPRSLYRPGTAEAAHAQLAHWRGELAESDLVHALHTAKAGRNRPAIRHLERLYGEWWMTRERWAPASAHLREAVRLAHEVGDLDWVAEAALMLAHVHLAESATARDDAERLGTARPASARHPGTPAIPHRQLSEVWLALGDRERGLQHARSAASRAAADGEPYVHRYELGQARQLLHRLGAPLPEVPSHDARKLRTFDWEDRLLYQMTRWRKERGTDNRTGRRR